MKLPPCDSFNTVGANATVTVVHEYPAHVLPLPVTFVPVTAFPFVLSCHIRIEKLALIHDFEFPVLFFLPHFVLSQWQD